MGKISILFLSFISLVIVNILANILPINNQTSGEISNRIPSFFSLANYVYSIWIVIYILLALWIWNIFREYRTNHHIPIKRVLLFVAICIFHISWVLLWHYEFFYFSLIIMITLLCSIFSLYLTYSKDEKTLKSRLPISIYLGWIFIATFVNIDYILTYFEFGGFGITNSLWTVIYLTIGTAIALHFRYHYNDRAIVLVFIWAFFGIAVHHNLNELLITAASLFLIGVLIVGIIYIKKTPSKS